MEATRPPLYCAVWPSHTGRGRMQSENRADSGLDRRVTSCAEGGIDKACTLAPILLLQNAIGLQYQTNDITFTC